jgi:hypothetical protein
MGGNNCKMLNNNKKAMRKCSWPGCTLKVYLVYSTVTDFAKFLGWSTLQPRITAIW